MTRREKKRAISLFPIVYDKGLNASFHEITCSECSATDRLSSASRYAKDAVIYNFEQKGWIVGKKPHQHVCPSCHPGRKIANDDAGGIVATEIPSPILAVQEPQLYAARETPINAPAATSKVEGATSTILTDYIEWRHSLGTTLYRRLQNHLALLDAAFGYADGELNATPLSAAEVAERLGGSSSFRLSFFEHLEQRPKWIDDATEILYVAAAHAPVFVKDIDNPWIKPIAERHGLVLLLGRMTFGILDGGLTVLDATREPRILVKGLRKYRKCATDETPPPAANTNSMTEEPTMNAHTPQISAATSIAVAAEIDPASRRPTRHQLHAIRDALDTHYPKVDKGYVGGMTDEKLAKSLDMPRIWIEEERSIAYGPERGDQTEAFKRELAAIRGEAEDISRFAHNEAAVLTAAEIERQLKQHRDTLTAAIDGKLARLLRRIDDLANQLTKVAA